MNAAADLHQRGLAAAAGERFEEAVALLAQAVALAPGVRQFQTNLGLGLVRLGRPGEAEVAYRAALALEPSHAGTLAKLGRLLSAAGRRNEAVEALERAAWLEPANADTANALGAALGAGGEENERAREAFRRAVDLDRGFGEAWRNLGLCEAGAGRWPAAAHAFGMAIELDPAPSAQSIYEHGVALGRSGRHPEACQAYRRAIEAAPEFAEAWNNLAHELAALGEPESACQAIGRALAAKPDYLDARYNLGVTLQSLGRIDEARRAYQLVLAAGGAHADTFNNLGGLCLSEAAPRLAIPHYRAALATNATHPEARWNLGLAQLSVGDWEPGWANYESRPPGRVFDIPRWRRGEALAGRGVLVWCEQGLGDGVQFARYALALRRAGAGRITVECPGPLACLLSLAEGIDEVVVRGRPLPPVDCQVSMMSLPYELETRPGTVPAPGPAYRLQEEARAGWRRRLDELRPGTPKVGVVWGGNAANRKGMERSMPAAELARLAGAGGVTLVSLQHGPQAAEADAVEGIAAWPQQDLADTAALVAELDLVITVDTLMAHVAGTVGRRTWVLLPFAADWRWMSEGEDTPWYPSMRLFRQRRPGDWAETVDRVGAALEQDRTGQ